MSGFPLGHINIVEIEMSHKNGPNLRLVKGMGKDIEGAGEAIQKAADKTKGAIEGK